MSLIIPFCLDILNYPPFFQKIFNFLKILFVCRCVHVCTKHDEHCVPAEMRGKLADTALSGGQTQGRQAAPLPRLSSPIIPLSIQEALPHLVSMFGTPASTLCETGRLCQNSDCIIDQTKKTSQILSCNLFTS